jgi:phage-related protein
MNEELKIIITAVTSEAKKQIQGVKKELSGVQGSAKSASSGVGAAMKGIGVAAAAAVAAIVAVGAALVKLGKASLDFQRAQAKLNTAFLSMGSTAKQAAESYNGLFRFLGDNDKSVEAASHLAKLTTNQQELAEWTKICQGIYATFGDSLPIEGLTEAANETARVGKITGTMADALNWAGVSEDAFNAKLAQTTSFEEREALIRSTLNGIYNDAAEIYERNNRALLEHNESQARLDASMAAAGKSVMPLMTALNNLSATLFDALGPAISYISNAMATFIGWVTQGIQAVMGLFGAVTGTSTSITTMAGASSGIGTAATGANDLASGLDSAAKSAEKAKRSMMGFDELNVVSSGSSSSSGGSGGAGGAGGAGEPGYMAPKVGAANFTMEVEQTENKASGFANMMKGVADKLKDVFAPTITAWKGAFGTLKDAWEETKPRFINGAKDIASAFSELGSYLGGTFIPDLVNSFSVNLAPLIADVFSFKLEELGKNFELIGSIIEDATGSLIIPALESIKTAYEDTFGFIGDAWAKHGEPLISGLTTAMDHIRSVINTVYEETIKPVVEKIIAVFNNLWKSNLGPMVENLIDSVMEIGECLLQLYNEFIAPIVDWIVANILPALKDSLNRTIEHLGKVIGFISDAISGMITTIKGIVQFITGVFTGDWKKAWEGVQNIFKGQWDTIAGIAKAAWELIKNPFKEVKTHFTAVWSNIKSAFGNVSDWFKDTFTKAWTAVKNVFSSGGKIFDGIKDGILSGLKSVINALITGINKVIKVPFDGINSALKQIRNVSIAGLKPFDWMPTISVPQIPKLAKGGIINQATIAMVGERGKEAVVPLENNTAWMDKLADKLADRLAARQGGPEKISLVLDGKELGWANINSINNITRQTGALQLVLA